MKRCNCIAIKCTPHFSFSYSDSGSRSGSSRHVPPGFLAVYVGPEQVRFLIPTRFLNYPIFITLLQQAEEEYGHKFSGGIVLPCEVEFFEQVLEFLDKDEKKFGSLASHKFVKVVSEVGSGSFSSKEGNNFSSRRELMPSSMQK